ncbi:phosphotransferase [Melghirimyces profundicolus]|uniref:phosphotransferase n=1 Tax=Melghirimyces profundicolus TaxID=1242148 RepID=UPI00147478F0|nr:phosphotransferase [Melghirimyces profundicolus]
MLANVPICSVREIQNGWDFFVLEINGEWMFRFPRRKEGRKRLKREAYFLGKVASRLPIPVPRYTILRMETPLPFGGYRKLEGVPLSRMGSRHVPVSAAKEIGRFLSTLHSLPKEEGFPPDHRDPQAWTGSFLELFDRAEKKILTELDPETGKAVTGWCALLSEHLKDASFSLCPVHGDLAADHLLVRNGHLSGVIDWGDARSGDPAHDFAALWKDLGEAFAREVARHYTPETDSAFWERADLYQKIAPLFGLSHAWEQGDEKLWQFSLIKIKSLMERPGRTRLADSQRGLRR